MAIPYASIKAAHDSGTPLTGYLKTMADKAVSDHNSRVANSSWWGNPVGQFQHSSTTDADWINALSSSTIGTRSRDSTWSSSFDIPYYESFVGQSGADSYGYGDARDAIGMSPQAFLGNSRFGYAGRVFNDIAIPMYGADGNVTGYAVPAAYVEPEYRIDKESGRDDYWAELSYKLNYDEGKLGENAVKAKLPGIGNAYLFKGEQQFNDVFGANPEPEFTSVIHKPERKGFFDVAIPALSMFLGANSLAGGVGSFLSGTPSVSAASSFANSVGLGNEFASFSSLVGDVASGIIDFTGATGNAASAINAGVNSAVTSGTTAALTGGDLGDIAEAALIGGATGAGASYVGGTVLEGLNGAPVEQMPAPVTDAANYTGDTFTGINNTVAGAAAGATGGLIGSTLSGADSDQIGDAVLTGAVAGGVGGLITDAGGGVQVSQAGGNAAGTLTGQALQNDTVADTGAAATAGETATADTETADTRTHDYALNWGDGPSFASLLAPAGRPEWGTRLNNGRAAP